MVQSLFCLWISNDYPNSLIVNPTQKMCSTLNKTKKVWNKHISHFCILKTVFAFVLCLILLLLSHATVRGNSIPNKSFYFYHGLSLVTNYYSSLALSDVSPLDNKEGHAAFTQWANKFSPLHKNFPVGVIWLTDQRSCEHVIQIIVCEGYLLLHSFKKIWGTRKREAGWLAGLLAGRAADWVSVSCARVIRELQQWEL